MATSPHQAVRLPTPAEERHAWFNMRADKAEALLDLCHKRDTILSTRLKIMSVVKRKIVNSLVVPTSANASFHIFKEVDLITSQAARSMFFALKCVGPVKRGASVTHHFETEDNQLMKGWFGLEDRRENGVGQAMLRNKGQVLVMARAPFLVEHISNDEADGIKLSMGLMTLNCRGVPRFAPPPPPENDTVQDQQERQQRADADLDFAWSLVKELAKRGSCKLDRHWYFSLTHRFGQSWLSYLSDQEASESEEGEEASASEGEGT